MRVLSQHSNQGRRPVLRLRRYRAAAHQVPRGHAEPSGVGLDQPDLSVVVGLYRILFLWSLQAFAASDDYSLLRAAGSANSRRTRRQQRSSLNPALNLPLTYLGV